MSKNVDILVLLLVIVCTFVILPFDLEICLVIVMHRLCMLDTFFVIFTTYGNYVLALAEGLAVCVICRAKNCRRHLIVVLSAYAGWLLADRIVYALKAIFRRPRPFEASPQIAPLVSAGGYSFPSGHASAAFALTLSLIHI